MNIQSPKTTKDKNKLLVIWLLITSGVVTVYLLVSTGIDGYWIWGKEEIRYDVTGQIGDFIGGVIGTIISAAGFYFLYLTLNAQRESSLDQSNAFERERLENKYFELVKMHRENVAELSFERTIILENHPRYKFDYEIVERKKVFRAIFKQFATCVNDLKPLITKVDRIYTSEFKKIILANPIVKEYDFDLVLLAKIDICYCIVFYGVGAEGLLILERILKKRYKPNFIERVLRFISLKPSDDEEILNKWMKLSKRSSKSNKRILTAEIYNWRETKKLPASLGELDKENAISEIVENYHNRYTKYYGGHQFRLGHYFRHLFQTVKFINNQSKLSYNDKYEYVKILRAQLSTYEQAVLFINSLSTMGYAWELDPQIPEHLSAWGRKNFELITKYNMIKNLPEEGLFGIPFKELFPKVLYEGDGKRRDNSFCK